VDERKPTSLQEIDQALKLRGFRRDWQRPFPCYIGELDRTDLRIPVSVDIEDIEFIRAPVVRLLRTGDARIVPLAHVAGPEGTLCYLDTRATVLDRYRPGETVVRCLVEAERVLRDALHGRSAQDFAGEFPSYWADQLALVDLPNRFEGEGSICLLNLRDGEYLTPLLIRPGQLPKSFKEAHRAATGKNIPALTESCRVVAVAENLSLDPGGPWPPGNIATLKDWLSYVGAKASGSLDDLIRDGKKLRRWLAIKAPNGCAIARIDIPTKFNTPEFLVSRKAALLSHLLREPQAVTVTRYGGLPIDERYLYSRNLGGMKTLAGKAIALIGCGAIGGFLAKELAQTGAGSNGGKLILIDNDVLQPGNLGRHLLGMRDLGRNKAEACRDSIMSDLPHLELVAEPDDALQKFGMMSRCALVIDATGEEALSISLNHFAVTHRPAYPAVLHVWLAGNGSIAQSLLCDGDKHACFKCMKPVLDGQPRYRAVRSENEIRMDSNAACGDGLFVPFPVSRAVAAAALGLDAALGWANDKPEPRFRNRPLDPAQAFNLKDSNPAPSTACPACGREAA
jgi:molybdopterin/thiamine biosynthesis adenylyltransferase